MEHSARTEPGDPRDVKVVVLGESGVGKTSIVSQFVHRTFSLEVQTTIGAAFASATLTVGATQYKLRLWDTAGQEKYHSLAPMYYRGALAAVIVFDLTQAATFRTVQHWVSELKAHGPSGIAIAVVGNKRDLVDSGGARRDVALAETRAYARSIGASYAEVSAKSGDGIDHLFAEICERLGPEQTAQQPHGSFITAHRAPQRGPSEPEALGCCT